MLRGIVTAVNIYFKEEKRPQINKLTFHLKKLEKKTKLNPKQAERKK